MPSSLWTRLSSGLARTKFHLTDRMRQVLGSRALSRDVLDDLEEVLIGADVGVEATTRIIETLEQAPERPSAGATWAIKKVRSTVHEMLARRAIKLALSDAPPTVILVVGVNGVGKTTTIGKLAARFASGGKKVLIGAADTFRAAADEQLTIWAERASAQIVRHQRGSDAASVAYDAVSAARARGSDVVLIDTAGRLHTKLNLMEELKKIKRVLSKLDPSYPHETLLVLDAMSGQNALVQAKQFHQAIGLSGIALTKLDSSAKGGIIIAIAGELDVPIKLVGVGEAMEDLQDFDPDAFVEALFGDGVQ